MSGFFQLLFTQNQSLLQFVYGLTFFLMGFATALQARSSSRLEIARSLRWLAGFGLFHGLYVWGEFFAPSQEVYLDGVQIYMLHDFHLLFLAVSYGCLLEFGLDLLRPTRRVGWLRYAIPAWLGLYLLAILFLLPAQGPGPVAWHEQAEALARYLIGFPGALLAAYALREQTYRLIAPLEAPGVVVMLRAAGVALALFALLGGLVPPPVSFFPGSLLNEVTFERFTGVPILVFLSVLAIILAVAVIRALEVFQVEMERRIETIEQQQILVAERERIGRELHDGTIQTAYTAGLLVDSARKLAEPGSQVAQRLDRAVLALDEVIAELRRRMGALRAEPSGETLQAALQRTTADARFRSLVEISLDWQVAGELALPPRDVDHILAIVYEGLSNVARHARASTVRICARRTAAGLQLQLEDDGVGIPRQPRPGFGLRNMQERARLLAGALQIEPRPGGKGTLLTLDVPLAGAHLPEE